MICCKNLFKHNIQGSGSVICLSWVLPLRIVAALSIIANSGFVIWRVIQAKPLNLRLMLVLAIHLFLCWLILREGQHSVEYHRYMRQAPPSNE